MKFTKIKFKLLKSANRTIQCWSNNEKLFETNIDKEPEVLENMKLFVGGQTDIIVASGTTKGIIQNIQIEDIPLQNACFFVKSCASGNDPGCDDHFRGDEILVLRNKEVVWKIESGFHTVNKCFATASDDTFEFHAGGSNRVS